MRDIKIGNKTIGVSSPTFIVAELSANHGNDIEIVKKSISAAKDAGVDAVKIQTFTPDTITIDCKNDFFMLDHGTAWDGRSLYDLYKEAFTPWEWHNEIFKYARDVGIICFSSPFDKTAVDLLEECGVPAYKIASFEITDIPLIEYVASKNKPIIISTGIATIEEIHEAVAACKKVGNEQVVLLKCTSSYPAPLNEMNLKTIPDIEERFKVNAGLSDHSMGISVPIGAVALGAKVVEKHFILDKEIGGPDAQFSLDHSELGKLVKGIREIEEALGRVNYALSTQSLRNREFSRSLFIVDDVQKGDVITENNVRSIRPGYGIAPKYIQDVLGKKFNNSYEKGTPMCWECICE